jgi:hypothetical protein
MPRAVTDVQLPRRTWGSAYRAPTPEWGGDPDGAAVCDEPALSGARSSAFGMCACASIRMAWRSPSRLHVTYDRDGGIATVAGGGNLRASGPHHAGLAQTEPVVIHASQTGSAFFVPPSPRRGGRTRSRNPSVFAPSPELPSPGQAQITRLGGSRHPGAPLDLTNLVHAAVRYRQTPDRRRTRTSRATDKGASIDDATAQAGDDARRNPGGAGLADQVEAARAASADCGNWRADHRRGDGHERLCDPTRPGDHRVAGSHTRRGAGPRRWPGT